MTELDELIAAEREHPPAAEPDQVRDTWKRISASAATGVPLPVDLSPAAVKVTASSKLAALAASTTAKVTIAVTLVGGSTVAVVAAQPDEPAPAASTQERQAETPKRVEAVAEPVNTTVPSPSPEPEPELEPEPAAQPEVETSSAPVGGKRTRKPPTEPPTEREEQDIAGELALIQAAQRSLRANDPQSALAHLRTHQQRYPEGTMNEDRLALRVLALCAANKHQEGEQARTKFLRKWPNSIYVDRVRQACEHDAPDPQ